MRNVLAIILGGGRGTRLYPLTKLRAKPAVPIAGKFRLIDIPVSNCINSEIHKIYILTQFNSVSLNRHINLTYSFSNFLNGFVEILAAQQTMENRDWFQGTADAVRQYIPWLQGYPNEEYLILAGDHLYRMDYRPYIEKHRSTGAEITVAVVPMQESQASQFGLLKIDNKGQIIEFSEKPTGEALHQMKVDTKILGLDAKVARKYPFIASMGIYVFKPHVLHQLLTSNPDQHDFGKELLPFAVKKGYQVQAYLFRDYWEDIGTVGAFYKANMDLIKQPKPSFRFYDRESPIICKHRILPPATMINTNLKNSIISEGCCIDKAKITNSIIGIRSIINKNTIIEDSLVMGADFYQTAEECQADSDSGIPLVGIGENTYIHRAIIDKNARIGRHVKIINKDKIQESERERDGIFIRDGIVIVTKNAIIPDGSII